MVAGTFNLLVVLIQWSGHEGRSLIPKGDIETMFVGSAGSIQDYLDANSYGAFDLQVTVTDYFQSQYTEQQVASGEIPFHLAMVPLLDELDDQGFDWSPFDNDGEDFLIDSIMALHTGYAREAGSTDEFGTPTQDRIQSLFGGFSDFRANSGYGSDLYARASIYQGVENQQQNTIGIIAHEFIHTLGPPDWYDLDNFDGEQYTSVAVGGVAGFDIM